MTPEKYRLAGELFHRVRELPKPDRDSALNIACNGDGELRAEIVALLEGHEEAEEAFLLDLPIPQAARLLSVADRPKLDLPEVVAGRYRMGEFIGAGGMGFVYRAEDLRLNRRVAMKLLPGALANDARERNLRFQREAHAVSQLNHPNIVAIYDSGIDAGLSFIAMELVEGQTLRERITGAARPDVRAVLDMLSQTASALSAAHEAGIIHRDIKPENIMVRPDGLLKILDFGLARMRGPDSAERHVTLLTRAGQVAGTMQYLSPEQVLGKCAGPQSDVFSLGVVAYEFVTGIRPFDGPTDGAIFDAILHRDPPPPSALRPELGAGLDALIMGALEKDSELRFQSAADFRSACKRCERSLSNPQAITVATVREADKSARVRPISKARWRGKRVAVAISALLVIAVTFGLYFNRPLPEPRVTRNVQITNGEPVTTFVNDGTRLYYSAGKTDSQARFLQVSTQGGQAKEIPEFRGMLPLDISADHSEILLGALGNGESMSHALWIGPALGGAPRRLGELYASYAHWSSRGDKIVYTIGNDVRIAAADGSGARVLFHIDEGHATVPFFFDSDRRIRFRLAEKNGDRLWEMNADGSSPHPVLPNWDGGLQKAGAVSADGKYFVFMAAPDSLSWDLWILHEGAGRFRFHKPKPVRLTTGPLVATMPQFSPDGRRIFYIGNTGVDELIRYDRKFGWVPYLGGMDAVQLNFSRDGAHVTYAAAPGRSIWCSRIDGTERRQLTTPPLSGVNPRWSPDGTKILFYGHVPGQPPGMFLVSSTGGTVIALTARGSGANGELEPSWSPDGRKVLYMTSDNRLDVIDIKSREIEKLPESAGLSYPRWSPDGRYAAAPDLHSHLWLYDMATHQRTLLSTLGAGYPTWSRDSKYVYFENNACSILYRVSVRDRNVEEVVSLADLRLPANSLGWVGVAPDGSVISARDVSTQNIYAIDWDPR